MYSGSPSRLVVFSPIGFRENLSVRDLFHTSRKGLLVSQTPVGVVTPDYHYVYTSSFYCLSGSPSFLSQPHNYLEVRGRKLGRRHFCLGPTPLRQPEVSRDSVRTVSCHLLRMCVETYKMSLLSRTTELGFPLSTLLLLSLWSKGIFISSVGS